MSKKENILKVAEIHFAQHGFALCSLDAVAKECHITKPAIYYHYKDKAALYEAVLYSSFSNLATYIEENTLKSDCISNLKSYIDLFGAYVIAHPSFAFIFSREIANNAQTMPESAIKALSRTLNRLESILIQGKKEGVFRYENPFMIQLMIVGTLTSYSTTDTLRQRIASVLDEKSEIMDPYIHNLREDLSQKIIKALTC